MADEQAQVEETTVNETTVADVNASEGEKTQQKQGMGNVQVPLSELKSERAKRQELESRLNDPNFIYEQAQRLGLAEGGSAESVMPDLPPSYAPQRDPRLIVNEELNRREVMAKYPELKDDKELQIKVSALINSGYDWFSAAEKEVGAYRKLKELEVKESELQKSNTASATGSTNVSSEMDEVAKLKKISSTSEDRIERENALLKLIELETIDKVKKGEMSL